MDTIKLYFKNHLLVLDEWFNVLFGGAPNQTISARLYDHRDVWAAEKLMLFVNWLFEKLGDGPNHCREAFYNEMTIRDEVL